MANINLKARGKMYVHLKICGYYILIFAIISNNMSIKTFIPSDFREKGRLSFLLIYWIL